MNLLKLLMKLPAKVGAPILFVLVGLKLIERFFFGSIWGVLVISIVIYECSQIFGSSQPYSIAQLTLWFNDLPTDLTAAVLSSLITIAGFLIAFHTASVNWKDQTVAQLKLAIASEIEKFFGEASRLSTSINIDVKFLLETAEMIELKGATSETLFRVRYVGQKITKFLSARERLTELSVEAYSIAGRHATVLVSVAGAVDALDKCVEALDEISSKVWIHYPLAPNDGAEPIAFFVRQIKAAELREFTACYDKNYEILNGVSGALRGSLVSQFVPVNVHTLLGLLNLKKGLVDTFDKLARNMYGRGQR